MSTTTDEAIDLVAEAREFLAEYEKWDAREQRELDMLSPDGLRWGMVLEERSERGEDLPCEKVLALDDSTHQCELAPDHTGGLHATFDYRGYPELAWDDEGHEYRYTESYSHYDEARADHGEAAADYASSLACHLAALVGA